MNTQYQSYGHASMHGGRMHISIQRSAQATCINLAYPTLSARIWPIARVHDPPLPQLVFD